MSGNYISITSQGGINAHMTVAKQNDFAQQVRGVEENDCAFVDLNLKNTFLYLVLL